MTTKLEEAAIELVRSLRELSRYTDIDVDDMADPAHRDKALGVTYGMLAPIVCACPRDLPLKSEKRGDAAFLTGRSVLVRSLTLTKEEARQIAKQLTDAADSIESPK